MRGTKSTQASKPWYLLGEWAMQRDEYFRNVAPTRLYPIHYEPRLLAQP
jgi:hypothetical protein